MSLGLIGSATPTGWDSDTDFVYDAENNVLSLDINLINGEKYKIRANNGWDIGFPGQFGPDSDGDGFLDTKDGDFTHEGTTGRLSSNPRCVYSKKVHLNGYRFVTKKYI